jgi:hypothetical protein
MEGAVSEIDYELPEEVKPWPAGLDEPVPLQSSPSVGDLEDGRYFSRWPEGQLRLLASVKQGRLAAWIRVAEDGRAGYFGAEGPPWCAQHYYADGRLEDFSPWDDSSEPYPAEISFEKWVRHYMDSLLGTREKDPALAERERQYEEYLSRDRSHLPQPHAERILSGDGKPPRDLKKMLKSFDGCTWVNPGQCYERLVNHFEWDPGWARDFTNFVPQACARAFLDRKYHQEQDMFLYPAWDRPGARGEASLEEIPLYARVRELAVALRKKAWEEPKHWVHRLADIHPDLHRFGNDEEKLSWPIIWTLPPKGICGFWMTMHAVSLMLRQEASRQGALWRYLEKVDRERFFHAASMAGGFLQASFCTSAWYFDPPAFPWRERSDLKDLNEDLAELIGSIDHEPLLAGVQSAHPYNDSTPSWMKAPILASLGEWVHRRCADGPPGPDERPVIYLLGRFINDSGDLLRHRLRAFMQGYLNWDSDLPPQWPCPTMNDMGGWHGYWQGARSMVRERGESFAASEELQTILPDLPLNAFLHRVEVAGATLVRGEPGSSSLWSEQAASLEHYLAEHSALPPEHLSMLRDYVLGVPVMPGRGYVRLLAAAFWVFSAFAPEAWEQPKNYLFPALRLAQWMISVF